MIIIWSESTTDADYPTPLLAHACRVCYFRQGFRQGRFLANLCCRYNRLHCCISNATVPQQSQLRLDCYGCIPLFDQLFPDTRDTSAPAVLYGFVMMLPKLIFRYITTFHSGPLKHPQQPLFPTLLWVFFNLINNFL